VVEASEASPPSLSFGPVRLIEVSPSALELASCAFVAPVLFVVVVGTHFFQRVPLGAPHALIGTACVLVATLGFALFHLRRACRLEPNGVVLMVWYGLSRPWFWRPISLVGVEAIRITQCERERGGDDFNPPPPLLVYTVSSQYSTHCEELAASRSLHAAESFADALAKHLHVEIRRTEATVTRPD
jgi:hypothetical protein